MLARIAFSTALVMCTVGVAASQDTEAPARLELSEIFRVGDDESAGLLFGYVAALDVNASGQVFTADGMANSVYILSGSGELDGVIGTTGVGPGEFEDISGLYVGPGDSIYVFDSDIYRLSVFAPGTYRFAYSFSIEEAGLSEPTELLGVVNSGFLIVYKFPVYPGEATNDRYASVNLVSRQGAVMGKPVVSLPDWDFFVSRRYALLVPFGHRYQYRLGADGLVYSGLNDAIDIRMTTVEGHTQGSIRYDHQAVPVTREDIRTYTDKLSPDAKRFLLTHVLPATMPAYRTFVVDDRGRIWVQHIGEGGGAPSGAWSLFNKKGKLVANAVLAASVRLYAIKNGIAYGTGSSESGATFIAAYKIEE